MKTDKEIKLQDLNKQNRSLAGLVAKLLARKMKMKLNKMSKGAYDEIKQKHADGEKLRKPTNTMVAKGTKNSMKEMDNQIRLINKWKEKAQTASRTSFATGVHKTK